MAPRKVDWNLLWRVIIIGVGCMWWRYICWQLSIFIAWFH